MFTLYLPVELWGQAEIAAETLEPGDEILISGAKLKYKSVLDSKTQQKSSKLIVSAWGILAADTRALSIGSGRTRRHGRG